MPQNVEFIKYSMYPKIIIFLRILQQLQNRAAGMLCRIVFWGTHHLKKRANILDCLATNYGGIS